MVKKDDDDREKSATQPKWLQVALFVASCFVVVLVGPLEVFHSLKAHDRTAQETNSVIQVSNDGATGMVRLNEGLNDNNIPHRTAPKPVPATPGTPLNPAIRGGSGASANNFYDLTPADRVLNRPSPEGESEKDPAAATKRTGVKAKKTQKPKQPKPEGKAKLPAPDQSVPGAPKEAPAIPGHADAPAWDTQAVADLVLRYRDQNKILDFSSLTLLLRTVQALRLRRAGSSDLDLARSLSAPDRLQQLGEQVPAAQAGKPLRILYFGGAPELGIFARANRGGIIDVVSHSESPVSQAKLREWGCGASEPGKDPLAPAACRPINVNYWTVLKRDKVSGRMGEQRLKIQEVLSKAKEFESTGAVSGGKYAGYDIVMVRGPPAYDNNDHGRMQSIATSSFAAAAGGSHVFVLNCGRDAERRWSEHYLAKGIPGGDTGYNVFPAGAPLVPSTALPVSSAEKLTEALVALRAEGKGVIGDTNALLPLWTEEGVRHALGKMEFDPVVGSAKPASFRLAERSGILCHFVRG